MKLIVVFLLLIAPIFSFAAQDATVVTDGAMVYKKQDYDSAVLAYLRAGKTVRLSSKKFGEFYRIQFKQGIIGYISAVDIEKTVKDTTTGSEALPTSKKTIGSPIGSKGSGSEGRARSFISKTYLGVSYSSLNYSEVFNETDKDENLGFFGVKFSMPMRYLSGPFVLDVNAIYHSGVPSYYDMTSPASRGISGRILIFDTQILYSLAEAFQRRFWVYIGGGVAINYSDFVVEISGSKQTLSDVTAGGVITGGMAYQLGRIAIKLEPKYYTLESSYLSVQGAIQYEF